MLGFGIEGFFHLRFEVAVEVFHHLRPFRFSFCDVIKLLFHLGREVVIHDFGEILQKEVVDHRPHVCWDQFAPFCSDDGLFGLLADAVSFQRKNDQFLFFSFLVPFGHVFALLYGADGRRVSGRTSDAQFFQFFNQACFVVAWRVLGEPLQGLYLFPFQLLPGLHRG